VTYKRALGDQGINRKEVKMHRVHLFIFENISAKSISIFIEIDMNYFLDMHVSSNEYLKHINK